MAKKTSDVAIDDPVVVTDPESGKNTRGTVVAVFDNDTVLVRGRDGNDRGYPGDWLTEDSDTGEDE